jgi:putative transcriptional regulator
MIRHHPQPGILSDYATGRLSAGLALAVACHLDGCETCDAAAAGWESLGGAFLRTATSVPLAPKALESTIARIGATPPHGVETPSRVLRRFSLPKPLLRARIGFRRWVSPDIWVAPVRLKDAPDARTYLIHARAGVAIPKHTHRGSEFTAVLHGMFRDDGSCYDAGDFACSGGSAVHAQTVAESGDCLCLTSAEAPMRMVSALARAVQTLAGTIY